MKLNHLMLWVLYGYELGCCFRLPRRHGALQIVRFIRSRYTV